MDNKLLQIVNKFAIKGQIVDIQKTGNGHINQTYKVITTERKYILQRINNDVFTDVSNLMNNIVRVTEHLMDKEVYTFKYKPTLDGALYYKASDGFYRLYKYVSSSICYEGIENMELVFKEGKAFGQFHHYLSDLDATLIYESIPNFHNTVKRYKNLLKSIGKDPVGRVDEVRDEINFLQQYENYYGIILEAMDSGEVPMRITHNDTKINNILFDRDTNEPKCIIDLDTVMPGSCLYDFGNAIQSLCTGENEDSEDTSLLKVNFDMYKEFLKGYYSEMKNTLTDKEKELLPMSVFIMTMELAIRFLNDYIDGDIYFSTSKPKHNLIRCRTQIALAKDILKNYDKLVSLTKEIIA